MKYKRILSGAIGSIFALTAQLATSDELNMPVGVTDISRQVYDLHMIIFWICVAIGALVFAVMFWSIIHHRRAAGHEAAQFHDSTKLELAWTIVPFVILIFMAVPATRVLIAMYDTGGEDMTIEVRGYQWKWQYKYLDDDLNKTFDFFSTLATPKDEIEGRSAKGEHYLLEVDKPLRIPANRKVRFLVTAEDVIHAWWVPDFGIKRDAVPGMINELWTIAEQPGIYRGQCTELCGKDHGFMPVVVEVLEEAEFDSWYAAELATAKAREAILSKTFTEAELMAEGEQVYGTFCASCHQANGQGVPPVFPSLVGTAVATGPRDEHIKLILNGVTGTAMQAFGKQLDAAQIAAVVQYERHSWGNNMGDITQPRDVLNLQTAGQ
jgi:cytochrome c oxidase subunit 2